MNFRIDHFARVLVHTGTRVPGKRLRSATKSPWESGEREGKVHDTVVRYAIDVI